MGAVDRQGRVDLDQLALRSGQGEVFELRLHPPAPVIGGEPIELEGGEAEARVEISRTTSGYALRLVADVRLSAPCARCLDPATPSVEIDAREVEQPTVDDPELTSPYVEEGLLDTTAWLHDAIALGLPEKILCRPDCAGICPVCGVSLNEAGPEHGHERPPDPRFAKLRELGER